jgi:hypothetical protein
MAKLGYARPQIEAVMKELKKTFQIKCRSVTFDSNLIAGRVERKNMLPTIDPNRES